MNQLKRCLLPGDAELSRLNLGLDSLPEPTRSWKRLGTMSIRIQSGASMLGGFVRPKVMKGQFALSEMNRPQGECQSTKVKDSEAGYAKPMDRQIHRVWLRERVSRSSHRIGQFARIHHRADATITVVGGDDDIRGVRLAKNTGPPGWLEDTYHNRGGPPLLTAKHVW